MEETFKNLLNALINKGVEILIALIILYIGFRISKIFTKLIKKGRGFNRLDKSVQAFTLSFVSITTKVIVILIVATIIGIPTTSLITLIGSAGVAIGLALQGGLSNVAGSIIILINKPFSVGDYIITNGVEGTVLDITMFYTVLNTIDGKKVTIPNGTLTSSNITNVTAYPERQLDLTFSVSYDSDIDKVKKVLEDTIKKNKRILIEKGYVVALLEHAASALIFRVRAFVPTSEYWDAYYEIEESVKKNFDKNKIEIPFDQLDVHMKK